MAFHVSSIESFNSALNKCLNPLRKPIFTIIAMDSDLLRSTHHAMARVQFLVNHAQLHYVVDIDIKGFFDNINHTLLIKQLWNMGIQDRKVLACISKMLKAEIDGEGIPTKGVTARWLVVAIAFEHCTE